jgi:hypothetical protein
MRWNNRIPQPDIPSLGPTEFELGDQGRAVIRNLEQAAVWASVRLVEHARLAMSSVCQPNEPIAINGEARIVSFLAALAEHAVT